MRRFYGFEVFVWMMSAAIVCMIGLLGWELVSAARSPGFELRKDEWRCTKDQVVSYPQAFPTGKSVILIPQTRVECVRWDRIGWEDAQ